MKESERVSQNTCVSMDYLIVLVYLQVHLNLETVVSLNSD